MLMGAPAGRLCVTVRRFEIPESAARSSRFPRGLRYISKSSRCAISCSCFNGLGRGGRDLRVRIAGCGPGEVLAADRSAKAFALRRDLSDRPPRSEEHTSELQSLRHLVCRLLLEN